MIKVTVYQTTVREMRGVGKTSGKPYHLRIQNVYVHTIDRDGNSPPVPEKIELFLDDDQEPWAVGDYQLHPSSLYVTREGKLQCSPRLVPLVRKAASAS